VTVDVVIPVLNEAHVLEKSVETVRRFILGDSRYVWRVVVVDNGSTDGTQAVARRLSQTYPDVTFMHLVEKGRGRALRYAWMQSACDIACYTDVDLSTGLKHLPELVDAIAIEGYDIAIGSRLMKGSVTRRCLKRELTSRAYNSLLKAALHVRFTDAQCGFKAISRNAITALAPHVRDESWFFDTELLVQAERQGRRIKEVPVVWIEDDDSRVKIVKTAWDDIKGVFRLWRCAGAGMPGGKTASAASVAEDAAVGQKIARR
jgi:glycosyltransferase involved in cell wall biosynthesis